MPSEASVYHDVVVFREIYQYGRREPFVPSSLDYRMESHSAAAAINVPQLEYLMRAVWQRSLLGLQSFLIAEQDFDKWMEIFFVRYEPFEVDFQRYAQAYHHPDPDKMRRFIIDNNFYNCTDPIIALARSIQRGQIDRTIDMESAVAAAATQSQYAQALHRGFRYLRVANDYFEGKIDERELNQRSDIGKPHVPPQKTT